MKWLWLFGHLLKLKYHLPFKKTFASEIDT